MKRVLRLDRIPVVDPTAFVAPGAVLVGDVEVGPEAGIWYNCVLRGDVRAIRIGARSNIQDLTCCHGQYGAYDVIVGKDVTVGHCALLHGCVIGDGSLVGMGARILNGSVIGEESIIAAGAVVLEGTVIPPRSLVVGLPGKVKRTLSDADVAFIREATDHYVDYAELYKKLSPEQWELVHLLGQGAPAPRSQRP